MIITSVQGSMANRPPILTQNAATDVPRRSANYHPSVWGDFFLAYSSNILENDELDEELQHLKGEVKKMLHATPEQSIQKLDLIDKIQRLGVAYHFESEIQALLQNIFDAHKEYLDQATNDLHIVALLFRLLRQQGYRISCDVFNKFKDHDGKFNKSLTSNNLRGILSLYEAANFRVPDENVLEEAITFTTSHLESLLPNLTDSHAAEIIHALKLPIRKILTRVGARLYMPIYENDESHNAVLLNFAKLDFNMVQKLHQKELCGITKWWKGLDCPRNFPFARDRLVELYFWASLVYFEPHFCVARKMLTKVIAMNSILDDIYDVYGTLDELTLLTDAIQRWHISELDHLPPYLKYYYQALLDVYSEMGEDLAKQGRSYSYPLTYAKASMKQLAIAYLEEAKWFYTNYVPSFEERMKVALVSTGYWTLVTNSFVGMGDFATEEAFEWISNRPLIVSAATVICRLMDDVVGHEFEQKRGSVASAVECYMKQYGASKQEAYAEFQRRVTNAWKDISSECLHPTIIPMPLLERVLNLARVIHMLYTDEDSYTHSKTKLKHIITMVLVDPLTT